jgi:hypothetical protein
MLDKPSSGVEPEDGLTRRSALKRGIGGLAAVSGVGAVVAACGGSGSSSAGATAGRKRRSSQ